MSASFWLGERAESRSTGRHEGRVDVAIVGGGITGCACALALAEEGLRVRLHEAREIASGASGRNGGFALRGGAMRYDAARAAYGPDLARVFWDWTERAQDRLAELAGDAFTRTGSLRLAVDEAERELIRAEYEALRADGLAAEWRDQLPRRLSAMFRGAIFHPPDGATHPARAVRKIAARAAAAGADLREHDRVEAIEELDADAVVIATDGYTRGLVPALDAAIEPARGQVLVTEPLPERLFDCPHYARGGFDYWQQLPDGRIVLGGFRDLALESERTQLEATTPPIQDALETFLAELVGHAPPIAQRWAGIFGVTTDLLPLAGRVPGREHVWVAAGYSGHGNVMGLGCGELVAGAILGREENPLLRLFAPARLVAG